MFYGKRSNNMLDRLTSLFGSMDLLPDKMEIHRLYAVCCKSLCQNNN